MWLKVTKTIFVCPKSKVGVGEEKGINYSVSARLQLTPAELEVCLSVF